MVTRQNTSLIRPAAALAVVCVLFLFGIDARGQAVDKYERKAAERRLQLKGRGFTVITERPFVVIGDDPADVVTEWSERVVRRTVAKLKREYFAKDPAEVLEIWLLRDSASYRKHTKEFFGDEPDTPFGYYSPASKALIMNISTGGGTLVHEIVHPFVEANFPKAPAWFNEGLGSLYEQSGEVDGRIYGFPNWRLPALKDAIRGRRLTTFKDLLTMSDRKFYEEAAGTNYAQARYLCYYLQERGLLAKFYREFHRNSASDPTGFRTLQRVLGERDMSAFQKKWERFVIAIEY